MGTQLLLLNRLGKLLDVSALTSESIFEIDVALYKALQSKHTAIRRAAVIDYALLLKLKSQNFEDQSNIELANELVSRKLNDDQLRLVETYVRINS
ncbi:hypothetical protein OGATHE_004212 [Ogataea polymorpha]|nr:hypothetical protein OGATHE_004212 [Ogataea polymorpha]